MYLFNHYLYTVKKFIRYKKPNIILTYNNVPLKNLISMNAVFKNYDWEGI